MIEEDRHISPDRAAAGEGDLLDRLALQHLRELSQRPEAPRPREASHARPAAPRPPRPDEPAADGAPPLDTGPAATLERGPADGRPVDRPARIVLQVVLAMLGAWMSVMLWWLLLR